MAEFVEAFSRTPAVCETVIAGYACEGLAADGRAGKAALKDDKQYLLAHAVELAMQGLSAAERRSDRGEAPPHMAATTEGYEAYLERIGETGREQLVGRAALLDNFVVYEMAVKALASETQLMSDRSQHPAFLAHGGEFDAFTIDQDSSPYVVRLPGLRWPERKAHNLEMAYTRLAAGVVMQGQPGFEQFVAGSLLYAATVSHLVQGKKLTVLSEEEVHGISEQVIAGWIDATFAAYDHKVLIDEEPMNVLLSPDQGIVFVDYELAVHSIAAPYQYRTTAVKEIARTIRDLAETGRSRFFKPEDFATRIPFVMACQQLILRILPIAAKKLKHNEYATIEKHSRQVHQELDELAAKYTDPEWTEAAAWRNRFFSR